jgi:hypothetical protein
VGCLLSSERLVIVNNAVITNFLLSTRYLVSRASLVGIVTGYGLDGRQVRVRIPVEARFSLLHSVQIGSGGGGGPQTNIPTGPGCSLPEHKARDMQPTTHFHLVPTTITHGSIYLLPHMSSWCRARLAKCRDKFTFSPSIYRGTR